MECQRSGSYRWGWEEEDFTLAMKYAKIETEMAPRSGEANNTAIGRLKILANHSHQGELEDVEQD
jgi:hypothetical protein